LSKKKIHENEMELIQVGKRRTRRQEVWTACREAAEYSPTILLKTDAYLCPLNKGNHTNNVVQSFAK
jgi:hypothetical protein